MKQKLAFAMLMGIVTTCIISFTLVSVNVGFTGRFLTIWLRSWAIAYLVVIPAILLIGPLMQKLTERLFPAGSSVKKDDSYNAFVENERFETNHPIF